LVSYAPTVRSLLHIPGRGLQVRVDIPSATIEDSAVSCSWHQDARGRRRKEFQTVVVVDVMRRVVMVAEGGDGCGGW
jgi:hypothetical protein